ncbi:MAG TPA: hypothetical protein VK203_20505 [Nostocaceae cyanobacterium]|nr:hypothetical protein [Nostocaceae cyanobacterium]
MEQWQFLIQKQGDRSWHTLEAPNLTIEEGNYRVLALSQLPNTDVEVRVTHFSPQSVPSRRRVIKRMRRANAEGLIGVVPFTHFKPGIWDLRCSADLMADVFGQSWQYSIQIQVITPEIEQPLINIDSAAQLQEFDKSSIEPIDSSFILTMTEESAITLHSQIPTETEEDKIINQPVSPVWFKAETAEQILQNLIDLALPASDILLEEKKVDQALPPPPAPPLKFNLAQDTYIAHWGETLTIHGSVELPSKKAVVQKFTGKILCDMQLVVELRSPLESEILTQIKQPLADDILPLEFSTTIHIPAHCQSKLILADITLYGAIAEGGSFTIADVEQVMLLASHTFTITADFTELLAITTDQASNLEAFTASNVTNKQPVSSRLGLELFNIAKKPQFSQFSPSKPSANPPLPPRIHAQEWESGNEYSPQLPKLPLKKKKSAANGAVGESVADTSQKTRPITAIDLEKLVIKQRQTAKQQTTLPYLKKIQTKPTSVNSIQLPAIASPQKKPKLQQNQPPSQTEVVNQAVTADSPVTPDFTAVTEQPATPTLPIKESIDSQTLITSPLLRKWWESQGYSVPEIEEIEAVGEVRAAEKPKEAEEDFNTNSSTDFDISSEIEVKTELEPEIEVKTELESEIELKTELEPEIEVQTEIEPEVEPEIEPEPTILIETQPIWSNQEIVIDDTYFELETETYNAPVLETQAQPTVDVSSPLLEALPTPQLSLPNGELVAGTSVRVKVELPAVATPVVVKLWVEDYQTRALLDGPHLLTDLLPNTLGGWEGTTQLRVPFGCLEIRLEAIALNITTKQESHKVTIVKTVVPPDLPVMNPDEILGL